MALKVHCPNKNQNGCDWTGELGQVDSHVNECEITCSKCKQMVCSTTMRRHLDEDCPCYCPYCDSTADREVISSKHKEKCHKFPSNNCGVDNIPQDKFYKANQTNELQNKITNKIDEMFNPSTLAELQKDIAAIRQQVAQSLEIAEDCSKKIDRQNSPPLLDRSCSIGSIVMLCVVILIALLLQYSPYTTTSHSVVERLDSQVNLSRYIATELDKQKPDIEIGHTINKELRSLQETVKEDVYKPITTLQQQVTLLQEVLNVTVANQQYQLSSSFWSVKLLMLAEMSNKVAPVIIKMSSFTRKLIGTDQWYSSSFFAFNEGYQVCLRVDAAGHDEGEGTHVSVSLFLMKGPHDDKLEQSGPWPLRGTFTIELLNQPSDNNHHSCMIQLHHYRCSECTNRVLEGVTAKAGWGFFIPHDILLHHNNNGYYNNDSLIFSRHNSPARSIYILSILKFVHSIIYT